MTITAPISDETRTFLTASKKLLIGGEWVEAQSGATFATIDPATELELVQIAKGGAADVDKAVTAARAAFEGSWSTMTPSERGKALWRLADLMELHQDELAELESLDNGKPFAIAKGADVALAIDLFRYMAGWATKIEGNTVPISVPYAPEAKFLSYTLREPVGVVGQIIPWNFPLLMAAWKLGPALTTGCTVVLKPAEQTPLTALLVGQLALEAGIPEGVLNVVTGFGDAGAALAAHPGVDKVAFTGSTEVGKLVVQAASGNLKKVSLELGGKSPVVIYGDADLESAIAGAANSIFFNTGQVCTAGSRLYIEEQIFDDVVDGVAEVARNIKVGNAFDAESQIGPLISSDQFTRVTGYLEGGLAQGAKAAAGGNRVGDKGYFVEPTLLTNVDRDMTVVREEIFGPVTCAMPFTRGGQPVADANDSEYGLAAAVWTNDVSKAHRTAAALQAGTVWINTYHIYDAAIPFGGYKQSGWGREMGHEVLNNYLETKSVIVGL